MLSKQEPPIINTKTVVSSESETERLKKDIYRSDMEKFRLFTRMLKANALYKRVKITHK